MVLYIYSDKYYNLYFSIYECWLFTNTKFREIQAAEERIYHFSYRPENGKIGRCRSTWCSIYACQV